MHQNWLMKASFFKYPVVKLMTLSSINKACYVPEYWFCQMTVVIFLFDFRYFFSCEMVQRLWHFAHDRELMPMLLDWKHLAFLHSGVTWNLTIFKPPESLTQRNFYQKFFPPKIKFVILRQKRPTFKMKKFFTPTWK